MSWTRKAEEVLSARSVLESTANVLSSDAAGMPIHDLLRQLGRQLREAGGGPLDERCFLAADALEGCLSDINSLIYPEPTK